MLSCCSQPCKYHTTPTTTPFATMCKYHPIRNYVQLPPHRNYVQVPPHRPRATATAANTPRPTARAAHGPRPTATVAHGYATDPSHRFTMVKYRSRRSHCRTVHCCVCWWSAVQCCGCWRCSGCRRHLDELGAVIFRCKMRRRYGILVVITCQLLELVCNDESALFGCKTLKKHRSLANMDAAHGDDG